MVMKTNQREIIMSGTLGQLIAFNRDIQNKLNSQTATPKDIKQTMYSLILNLTSPL